MNEEVQLKKLEKRKHFCRIYSNSSNFIVKTLSTLIKFIINVALNLSILGKSSGRRLMLLLGGCTAFRIDEKFLLYRISIFTVQA